MAKKLVFPKTVKARVWRELVGFDPLEDGVFNYDGTCEKIAAVYGCKKEDVEENFELAELLPEYLKCVEFVNGQVVKSLEEIPKKKEMK